jgi:DNA-binding transcriptional regulator LsrR (DeoR family)
MAGAVKKKRDKHVPSENAVTNLDHQEMVTKVCRLFCEGKYTLAEIAETVGVGREIPYRLLQHEAGLHRFEYVAPLQFEQAHRLETLHPWVRLRVVHSTDRADVAFQAARWLADLIRQHRREKPERDAVHIGFAGGALLSETARLLARILQEASEEFRQLTFVFHAIVAGFNPRNPLIDPNAFFSYFAGEPTLQVSFVNLLAPGFVTAEAARTLRTIKAIGDAYVRAKELDIVVTSAGAHWTKGCSRLSQLYKEEGPAESLSELQKANTIGDLLWRPISDSGPVEVETGVRALTLIDLPDLPPLIRAGNKVVVALGPCGTCGGPKGDVLRAVLGWKGHYITHVVVDSRTAAEALARIEK